ncbi:MAG TPA: lipoprotein insertase outer membrane protein LolB [Luteimonas sp.]|nr:lipoprotein insertase outer membrane protein LolB [Luteimonas sp.]
MSRLHACTLAAVAVLLLAGCVTQPTRAPAPLDPEQARLADLQRAAIADWQLSGRVAISNGRQGGSGRLDWTQQGERYVLALSAPVTRQGWRLTGDAGSARLEGIEGGPRESRDVEDLLYATTGWDIPVRAMVDWVRGVAAPREAQGPARVEYGAGSLPASIDQAGWRIEYGDWYEAGAGQPAMPKRIEARRGEARVRLAIDGWTLVPGAAAKAGEAPQPD